MQDTTSKGKQIREIAVHLIGKFAEEGLSVLEAFKKLFHIIRGSMPLPWLTHKNPEVIYVAKNKSPLLIGLGKATIWSAQMLWL